MAEIRTWTEDDGTELWLIGGEERGPVPDLRDCEARIVARARPGAVIGANADASDRRRIAQLHGARYVRAFSMVRMHRTTTDPIPSSRPDLRVRAAEVGDADAMHALTEVVWAGRHWFTMPSRESYRDWLTRWDRSLMLLAFDGVELIGYVAAEPVSGRLRIDDVQTRPSHQRGGVATELVRRLLVEAADRGMTEATLETEGGDPAGARTLYGRLGFVVTAEALRFRKTVV